MCQLVMKRDGEVRWCWKRRIGGVLRKTEERSDKGFLALYTRPRVGVNHLLENGSVALAQILHTPLLYC